MKKIFKYPLEVQAWSYIWMKVGTKVLDIQVQNGEPYIWAMVPDEETEEEKRIFNVVGTGFDFHDEGLEYIATFQMPAGKDFHLPMLVFHAFEDNN